MTAPDVNADADVRARFEAWHDAKWPRPNTDHPYLQEAAEFHWRQAKETRRGIWQAAHADLAGEVRELVEAIDEVQMVVGGRLQIEWPEVAEQLEAALAKLQPTHQEKP